MSSNGEMWNCKCVKWRNIPRYPQISNEALFEDYYLLRCDAA